MRNPQYPQCNHVDIHDSGVKSSAPQKGLQKEAKKGRMRIQSA
jgi:hypothetical protein